MKRTRFMNHPTPLSSIRLDDYNERYRNDDWQENKALRMQIKRWRKLKHQLS